MCLVGAELNKKTSGKGNVKLKMIIGFIWEFRKLLIFCVLISFCDIIARLEEDKCNESKDIYRLRYNISIDTDRYHYYEYM